jgi:hypothetical protein
MNRIVFSVLAILSAACGDVERSEVFPLVPDGAPIHQPAENDGAHADACEPGVVSILVGFDDEQTATAGACFNDVECYAHDYDGTVEVACWFVGCADPAYETLESGEVVELEIVSPCL